MIIQDRKILQSLTLKLSYILKDEGVEIVDAKKLSALAEDIALDLLLELDIKSERLLDFLAHIQVNPKVLKLKYAPFVDKYREQFNTVQLKELRTQTNLAEKNLIAEGLKEQLKNKEV